MKKLLLLVAGLFIGLFAGAQTPLTEALNFHVKTLEGTPHWLFDLLDDDKIVVIDFFTTSCGPCQEYAPAFQEAYEEFGENQSNVFFIGINYGESNQAIREFDSIFGLTYPSVSGIQGGGTNAFELYEVESYPTIIVITPDQQIVEQYLWIPTTENIIDAVLDAGGLYVSTPEIINKPVRATVYPNPVSANSILEITYQENTQMQYQVVNIMGAVVYQSEKAVSENGVFNFTIPANDLRNGLYFVRVLANEKTIHTTQFVVSH